jgi:hypothetical protein
MPGQHQDAGGPNIVRDFDVMGMVADNKRTAQIKPVFGGRLLQEQGVRFHTGATVLASARAAIERFDAHAGLPKLIHHEGIDAGCLIFRKQALPHSGLVRHNEQTRMHLEAQESVNGVRKEHNLARIAQVAAVFNQRPVAIEKHGGLTGRLGFLPMAGAHHPLSSLGT